MTKCFMQPVTTWQQNCMVILEFYSNYAKTYFIITITCFESWPKRKEDNIYKSAT